MTYDTTVRDEAFERLGIYVRLWYDLEAMKGTLGGALDDAISAFNISHVGAGSDAPSEADKTAYEALSAEIHRQQGTLDSLRYSVANMVSDFLGVNVKDLLDSPYSSPADVLNQLIDLMGDNGDSVQENVVDVADMAEDEDNSVLVADGVTLPTVGDPPTQLARNDVFSLVCADGSVVDQERWTLQSGRNGQYSGQVVTGVPANWEAAGLAGLTVNKAPFHDEVDSLSKVSDWKMAGAVKGTNVSSDGHVWAVFHTAPTLADSGDDLNQVENWSLTTAVFGAESDVDGKLHVSVVKDPGTYVVLGGTTARIDVSSVIVDGADDTNTNDGTLYVKVIKEAGTTSGTSKYTIELYSNAVRTGKVSSGVADNVEDLPVTVALTHETGETVDASITLSDFKSTQNGTDSTIQIRVPRYFVRLYHSSGRSESDLVSEGVSYTPAHADLTLSPVGAFTTTGDVDLTYIEDNEAIELTVDFYTIDLYRADPLASGTTDADVVARAGSQYDLLTCVVPKNDLALYAVNGSGLSDVSLDVAAVTVTDGYKASAVVGYANGDLFTFRTTTDDGGRFQTFLRETFNAVFPASDEPTVSDDLAPGSGNGIAVLTNVNRLVTNDEVTAQAITLATGLTNYAFVAQVLHQDGSPILDTTISGLTIVAGATSFVATDRVIGIISAIGGE